LTFSNDHIHLLLWFGNHMAGGGDAPSVPVWDMAILAGAVLLASTMVIVAWTQPVQYELDGPKEILVIHTGLSEATLSFKAKCTGEECDPLSVWIIPHDGLESWDGGLSDAQEVELLDQDSNSVSTDMDGALTSGEYRIILDGTGSYTFETTVHRTLPHEYLPAIVGSLLLIWGIWRKQHE